MLRFFTSRFTLIALLAMAVPSVAIASVTTVELRSTVRISFDEPVTLGQISTIAGDQSELLDGLVIEDLLTDTDEPWMKVGLDALRALIAEQPNLNEGSVVVRGGEVSIRRLSEQLKLAPRSDGSVESHTEEMIDGPVVRDHIDRWVRDRYKIGDDLFRMNFRDHDEPFLKTSTSDRLVEIREISRNGRTAIRVIVLDSVTVAAERALIFDVEIFRSVLIATERVNRGKILDATKIMTERRWVRPDEFAALKEDAIGMAMCKTVNPGQMIQSQHIEFPVVIRRGDIVSAKSISGSVVVTVRGRAKANARLGETIEFESMNGQNSFRAKANGKGRAVILKENRIGDRS